MSESEASRELVERVQRGERAAFDTLTIRYRPRVVRLVSRYVSDPGEVLDVVQETFLRAYRGIDSFNGRSEFYTWLYRIAVNTAKNHRVAMARHPRDTSLDNYEGEPAAVFSRLREHATPEALLVRDEVQRSVVDAVDALPCDLRRALVLRELEGMSYRTIAREMGTPMGTVRSRIFRARESIDQQVASLGS